MGDMDKNINKKIMIVDDDSFLLDMYSMKFKAAGYSVIVCSGGDDALDKIKQGEEPDVFVFDIIMPKMDGVTLYENLKKESLIPNAVKIVLTNQGQIEDKEKVEEMDVDGYIVKALHTPSEVVEKVGEIVSKK